ncbi:MAG: hypothetical protein WD651_05830 [Acidimicrobiia bacterium]
MRKLFLVLAVALIVLLAVVVIGPSLPEENVIRGLSEDIRDFFAGMGRGFGGGYQPIGPTT